MRLTSLFTSSSTGPRIVVGGGLPKLKLNLMVALGFTLLELTESKVGGTVEVLVGLHVGVSGGPKDLNNGERLSNGRQVEASNRR